MATENGGALFAGAVEADERYIGGKRRNMSNEQGKELRGGGRGTVGKTAVVGVRDRATDRIAAKAVGSSGAQELQGMMREQVKPGAKLYREKPKPTKGWRSLSMRR